MMEQQKINFHYLNSQIRNSLPHVYYILPPLITEKAWHCSIYHIDITEEKRKQMYLQMNELFPRKFNDDKRIALSMQIDEVLHYAVQNSPKVMSIEFAKVQEILKVSVIMDKNEQVIFDDYIDQQDSVENFIELILISLEEHSVP